MPSLSQPCPLLSPGVPTALPLVSPVPSPTGALGVPAFPFPFPSPAPQPQVALVAPLAPGWRLPGSMTGMPAMGEALLSAH